jgi:hypothetical protein
MTKRELLTGQEHQDGRAGDVSDSATPASDHSGPEGDKVEEERNDEQGNHSTAHI